MNILTMIPASRRRVTTDPDALDYFSRAEALGGSFDQTAINALYTEAYMKSAISDCIAGLKTDAAWDKIIELYIHGFVSFAGLMAKVKHVGTETLTNNNFVSGDYLAAGSGAGLKGNASDKYLGTSINDNILNPDSKSISRYATEANTVSSAASIGIQVSELLQIAELSNNRVVIQMPASSAAVDIPSISSRAFYIGSRRGVNDFEAYRNGVTAGTDTTTPSQSSQNLEWYLFGRNQSGLSVPTNARISAFHIGTGLTDTEAANLSSRINTLMTAIGANVY
jgi:hypothetical protein